MLTGLALYDTERWGDLPSPVPFPGHEPGNTFFLDHPNIFQV